MPRRLPLPPLLLPCFALVLWPGVAHADVVWPALMLEVRLFSWWAIGLGLVVEFAALRWAFGLEAPRAAVADLAMNAASCLLGLLFVPFSGLVWEIVPGALIQWVFDVGTFNPATWAGTFALAVAVNTGLEGLVLRKGFRVPMGRREWLWLAAANAASVGLAFGSLFTHPLRM